jgi:hypothetical protein
MSWRRFSANAETMGFISPPLLRSLFFKFIQCGELAVNVLLFALPHNQA